jgi:hypothetical protein
VLQISSLSLEPLLRVQSKAIRLTTITTMKRLNLERTAQFKRKVRLEIKI